MSDGNININIKAEGEAETTKAVEKVGDAVENTAKKTESASDSTKNYTNVIRLLSPSLAQLTTRLRAAATALAAMAKNPYAVAIAAITAAVLALKKAFDAMAASAEKAVKAALAYGEKQATSYAQRVDARAQRDKTEADIMSVGENAQTSEDVAAAIKKLEEEKLARERALKDASDKKAVYAQAAYDAEQIISRSSSDEEIEAARESLARLQEEAKELANTELAQREALRACEERTAALQQNFEELAAAEEEAAKAAEKQALAEKKAAAQQALADYDDWAFKRAKDREQQKLFQNGSYEEASASVSASLAEKTQMLLDAEKKAYKGAENGEDISGLLDTARSLTQEIDSLKDTLDNLKEVESQRVAQEIEAMNSSLATVGRETLSAYIGAGGTDVEAITAIVRAMTSTTDVYARTTADATSRTAEATEELLNVTEAQAASSSSSTDYAYVILA